jgi:adenylate cyclase
MIALYADRALLSWCHFALGIVGFELKCPHACWEQHPLTAFRRSKNVLAERGKLPGVLARPFRTWWKHKVSLAISLGVTAVALIVYLLTFVGERPTQLFDFIHRLELNALDTRFLYRGSRGHPDPRIVIVDIDQRSQEVLGRWPFSRAEFARMLDVLREDGARVVAFDITFSKPEEVTDPLRELRTEINTWQKQGGRLDPRLDAALTALDTRSNPDDQFAQAIERSGRVVLGNFFLYSQSDLAGLDQATLDRDAALLAFFSFPQARTTHADPGRVDLLNLIRNYEDLKLLPHGAEANLGIFGDALRGEQSATGFFNVQSDPDGVVRHSLLVLPYGRSKDYKEWDLYASIDVQAVRLFLGLRNDDVILYYGPTGVVSLDFGPALRVRPDAVGRTIINFQGPVRTFPYHSIGDVVNRNFPPGTFKDKLVLVGASATGIGDLRSTPYGGLDYPGVEVHANVIDNILNQNFLARGASQVAVDLSMILLFGIPVGFWLAVTQPRWMWIGLTLLVPFAGYVYFVFLKDAWLNFTMPALTLTANVGLLALYRVLVEDREKQKIRTSFQQYLSPEVIRRLLENPGLVKPRKTEITTMFSDIRDFTTISESLDPQMLALLLNHYLTQMTKVVFDQQGTLDKYIGDAIMAFWGAPFENGNHAKDACRAALQMMQQLSELQKQWAAENKPVLNIGIGIHTGIASVGNMGSELRYGYTAMGDAVNLASRLEGLNKEFRTHILTSAATYEAAGSSNFVFRELDRIRVKGKTRPVTIYELVSSHQDAPEHSERLEMFAQGRAHYEQRQWREAQQVFECVLARWPDDGPSRTFWKRCQEYLFEEPEPNWDGIFLMSHK